MEMGLLRGFIAVLTMLAFIGICYWAYRPGNRDRFEADGYLPFESSEGVVPAEEDNAHEQRGAER